MKNVKIKNPKLSKKQGNSKIWFIYLALTAVTVSIFVTTIVDQQIKINNAKAELEELKTQSKLQQIKNDDLLNTVTAIENQDEEAYAQYVEKVAREDLDYVKNGEVVFVNITGN